MSEIKLGQTARDIVTGYEGIVSVITTYEFNGPRASILPRTLTKEGAAKEELSFDQCQLEVVDSNQIIAPTFDEPKFSWNEKVKDPVSGYTGTVFSRSFYMNGCVRLGIRPPYDKKNGKMPELDWLPEQSLISLEPKKKKIFKPEAKTGGPMPDAPSSIGDL